MNKPDAMRQFSPTEVERILRMAAHIEETRRSSLSASELVAIAAEVGIDAASINEAIRVIADREVEASRRGPVLRRLVHRLTGGVAVGAIGAVVISAAETIGDKPIGIGMVFAALGILGAGVLVLALSSHGKWKYTLFNIGNVLLWTSWGVLQETTDYWFAGAMAVGAGLLGSGLIWARDRWIDQGMTGGLVAIGRRARRVSHQLDQLRARLGRVVSGINVARQTAAAN